MNHLALAVGDQERSRRFYATYLGFDAPPREYSDGVLMLYNSDGFSLALGPSDEPVRMPRFFHFGISLPTPEAVRSFRHRVLADGVAIVEEWEEPDYVSVKILDPDGYVVETPGSLDSQAWQYQNRANCRG
ncbi:MAG TPA: VOC family protein [Actinomycetota bacterium]|nr:VOC family protein [Actinomycetota bacterium]